ncbi:hypothetical protein N7508_004861 [Penicillium antarcticum]|uniref:uncharacterized protein n=1 Tax=Penicillium antarcticum TaxID=416450 RepID=UPI0023A112F3|nr:uncharacterized protein N7508_004861 [Penicillium antarcticum]KAJ5305846.1 hypothetical protein N7508_004861 [Penicillium antarcticum]
MRFYMITIATFIGLALASPVEVEKRVTDEAPASAANEQLFHSLQNRRWKWRLLSQEVLWKLRALALSKNRGNTGL